MKTFPAGAPKLATKFRMPTSENLVPIRVDVEVEGQRFKDTFTWNPTDPDSEVVVFARRTVKDLKLPPAFITPIAQSIQSQLTEFRSYEGQEMSTGEKVLPLKLDLRVNNTVIRDQFLWDINNFESDPEEFARIFCKELDIGDPEVGDAWCSPLLQLPSGSNFTRLQLKVLLLQERQELAKKVVGREELNMFLLVS
ncbi:chromatin structure-remodeling complex protein BSH isoform X3 [Nymphaea colorata]|uniref:chromatin structure-remodeling complex protein BSH isoform X3 n=1 Tax=Nymphaea colorata TaxID=210225 RepID=UPI00129E0DAE|nr:chromatin structure-remodeling complex protein BSH isoform X3 [Nymphaea colorata]